MVAVPALTSRRRPPRDRRASARAALALVLVTTAARAETTPAVGPEVEAPPRLSLPTEADRDAWRRDGFRLALGLHYGEMAGLAGPPNARLIGATLRVGLRLDADWSVLASFQYAVMSRGLTGLRFAGTLDPTWHATRHLSLAIGLGFAGISGGSTGGPDIAPLPNTLAASYTFPTASPPMPSCSGGGVAALVRAEWMVILGSRSATTFGVEGFGQWTTCESDTGVVDLDTGQSIVRRQAWPHLGLTGTWGIMWR
ncbi:MAG: hypothetical protein JWM82_2180 [Myxococcales bacterium]|nr:hypothetical protein [Myxococcales bacterium]